jgi:hypothetical protein
VVTAGGIGTVGLSSVNQFWGITFFNLSSPVYGGSFPGDGEQLLLRPGLELPADGEDGPGAHGQRLHGGERLRVAGAVRGEQAAVVGRRPAYGSRRIEVLRIFVPDWKKPPHSLIALQPLHSGRYTFFQSEMDLRASGRSFGSSTQS